jgi:hypothetical protein
MRQGEGEQREEMMMSIDREGAVRELRFGRRSFSDLTAPTRTSQEHDRKKKPLASERSTAGRMARSGWGA